MKMSDAYVCGGSWEPYCLIYTTEFLYILQLQNSSKLIHGHISQTSNVKFPEKHSSFMDHTILDIARAVYATSQQLLQ